MVAATQHAVVSKGRPGPVLDRVLALLLLGLFAASIAVPLADFLAFGPVRRLQGHGSAVQGGIEALGLALALCALAWRGGRWAYLSGALIAALYLRRHHVDLPLLVALCFWEGVAAAGAVLLGRSSYPRTAEAELRAVVGGLVLWLCVSLVLSALHLGFAHVLLPLLGLFAAAALALARRRPVCVALFAHFGSSSRSERVLYAALLAWMLVLFARTNNVVGFDALWYLARGNYVLAPGGSIFDALGLVSPVHYYPKLYELLILPFSALGDFSFEQGVSVLWLFLLGALVVLMCLDCGLDRRLALAAAVAVVTLPAIGNDPLTLKPDLPAAFFLAFAAWQGARWLERRDGGGLACALAGLMLACSSKLVALPYAGVLFLGGAVLAWWRYRQGRPRAASAGPLWRVTALALAVALVLFFRTWWLAGLPTIGPDPLFELWTTLGLELREPAGTLQWAHPQDWRDVLPLLGEMLWFPSGLSHIRFTWVGNLWLLLPLAALIAATLSRGTRGVEWTAERGIWLASALMGLLLAIAWRYLVRGGDGNYHGYALTIAIVLGVSALGVRLAARPLPRRTLFAGLLATALFQAWQSFLLAGWGTPGTQSWDGRLWSSCFDTRELRAAHLRRHGVEHIAAHLASLAPATRIFSVRAQPWAHWLPGRVEDSDMVRDARREYLEGPARLAAFLELSRTEYLLVPKDPEQIPAWVHAWVEKAVAEHPDLLAVDDEGAWLLDLRGRYDLLATASRPSPRSGLRGRDP